MSSRRDHGLNVQTMRTPYRPIHLELHTPDLGSACGFYALLCGWHPERIYAGGSSYLALDTGGSIGGGIVECETTERAVWLPYVEVGDVAQAAELARLAGASVLLEPREGPAGWRSVIAVPAGAEVGLFQAKVPTAGFGARDGLVSGTRELRNGKERS